MEVELAGNKISSTLDNEGPPRLAILVPVFNEAKHVGKCLQHLFVVSNDWHWRSEIIVVDDGSTDGTDVVLREFISADSPARILLATHKVNQGKGAAIRTGLALATANRIVIQDADLEYDPKDLQVLMARMTAGECEVVYGSRCLIGSRNPRRCNAFAWGVSLLNLLVWILYRVRLTDEATCYKLFRTEDLRRMELECKRFEFCPEATAKACRLGLRIVEVPISYRPRNHREGKKIKLSDGWHAIQTLWQYRTWKSSEQREANNSITEGAACTR